MLSALALVVLSPLLFLIAALVKLTSPGPVLYSQERMGLDGRSFRMWKFRSMRVDAEARTGAVWAQASDGRRTAFGTFLRKTSLDELPQLWNVLRGDMSLVGPRPERPVFVQRFRKEIPYYMLRHKVQAGITGWAQVNGWRGNTSLDRRIECDLFYIRNWSYALDLKILTLTLWKGFIHKNAY
jgi:exopolysaccharide biosynthesis polyprenyl glycosylphosphotransferase